MLTLMRILVVEDEAKTAAYLRKGLAENGFVVDVAHNGTDGQHLAQTQDYDLILLDVMLPGTDGWTILQSLRRSKHTRCCFSPPRVRSMTASGAGTGRRRLSGQAFRFFRIAGPRAFDTPAWGGSTV